MVWQLMQAFFSQMCFPAATLSVSPAASVEVVWM